MKGRRSAADGSEEAELRALSKQAEHSREALGLTVQALARKIADGTDVRALAHRGAAAIGADARRTAAEAVRAPVSSASRALARGTQQVRRSGYLRTVVIGGPAVLLVAFAAWHVLRRTSRP